MTKREAQRMKDGDSSGMAKWNNCGCFGIVAVIAISILIYELARLGVFGATC